MESELEFLKRLDVEYCHGVDWLHAYENARQLVKARLRELHAAQIAEVRPTTAQQAQPAICDECGGKGETLKECGCWRKCLSCGGTGTGHQQRLCGGAQGI